MRTPFLVAGVAAFVLAGSGLAFADDDDDARDDRRSRSAVAAQPFGDDDDDRGRGPSRAVAAQPFELEIDPDLDAQFPDRPVKAAQAADIVTGALGGGGVSEVELEEENGRPYWAVEVDFGGRELEAAVDAFTGDLLELDD